MNGKLNPIIEFKQDGLRLEFTSLDIDSRLYVITLSLAGFVYFSYGKSLLITEIYRTQQMQDQYYRDNEVYKLKPFKSVHQFWRGIDISLKYFTAEEIKKIEEFLNKTFKYSTAGKKTALIHDVGFGTHLHIQVDPEAFTIINKTNHA